MNEILNKALCSSFFNSSDSGTFDFSLSPQLVVNDEAKGKKVLSVIEKELSTCDSFILCVAFITSGGLEPLLQVLDELREKGIKGKILTTNYMLMTDPTALEKLANMTNIDLRMYQVAEGEPGFHTKGYIFHSAEYLRFIIGSSNITQFALTTNKEWNIELIAEKESPLARGILTEFDSLFSQAVSVESILDTYRELYATRKAQLAKLKQVQFEQLKLKPNAMQCAFIDSLKAKIGEGQDRALLISATGTGKTYASAFAMQNLGFKKVLFLVHRNQIALQALESFERVFSSSVTMGVFSGSLGKSDTDKDFIFATMQTLSKGENLHRFPKDYFEAIIYDEAHHTAAASYKKIMDYFTPKFSLGMTATPDKRDDNIAGRNIYEIFNYQIAYEIRLQNAMEENMLCPFHYFGISDLAVINDNQRRNEDVENFRYLTNEERVSRIIEKANYYGFSGDRVKGLIFCSRIDEAKELSRKLNEHGLRTVALSGADSEDVRAKSIERLVGKDNNEALDYILTVDIFSEGVDIPEINQVIMLRPTQSPIVFIQQLGRGLRKANDKEFVVVLDFIGNYYNNYMIPIALSGDRTYNKDNIRRYVAEGSRVIPGASTVHFDEVARKRIFQSIDTANFSDLKLIKENYTTLKNKIGHIPSLLDFDRYGEMDVLRIFDNSNLGSYYKFLVKYEDDYKVRLSRDEEQVVEFISKKLANGKRVYELELLNEMFSKKNNLIGELRESLDREYSVDLKPESVTSVVHVMTNQFLTGTGRNTYEQCVFLEDNSQGDYRISTQFEKMLLNKDFYNIIKELVEFGISRYKSQYRTRYFDTDLVLNQKYTYEDVCRLLNWEVSEVSLNIGGYKFDKKTKTFPVFINYEKDADISDTTKYEDHFISNSRLIAISKSGRSRNSEDVQNFLYCKERGIDVELFVRKNKDDKISKEFYYLGRMTPSGKTEEFTMPNTTKKAVEIEWILDTPVRDDIYEYIVNG